ncbi:MAG: putative transposase [Caballeronia mineralivorans]|jgi:hypothetical protein|nr:putative transposase [Caballeronia mineralivorans]
MTAVVRKAVVSGLLPERCLRDMNRFSRDLMHMIRKGQMKTENGTHPSAAEQFYSMVM